MSSLDHPLENFIKRTFDANTSYAGNVGVTNCGANTPVSEKKLNVTKVRSTLKQMNSETMP